MKETELREAIKAGYARIARRASSQRSGADSFNRSIGYSEEELRAVPHGANLGLGCGNPVALASLREGETVLDLGSGVGFDCFLAANKVGKEGKVIGVDITPEMIERARENAKKGGYRNVEFKLGEIENLPIADSSVDVIISNCTINLAPDKSVVFKEAYRVLKANGRLIVSDIILVKELPDFIKGSTDAYIRCLVGAITRDEYLAFIEQAGFQEVGIVGESPISLEWTAIDPAFQALIDNLRISAETLTELIQSAMSIKVQAVKPG